MLPEERQERSLEGSDKVETIKGLGFNCDQTLGQNSLSQVTNANSGENKVSESISSPTEPTFDTKTNTNGVDTFLEAEEILGGTDLFGDSLFLIKWKNVTKDLATLIPEEEANRELPQLVIEFYQSCLTTYSYREQKRSNEKDNHSQLYKGLEPEEILGATDLFGETMFLMKCRGFGKEQAVLLVAREVRKRWPLRVLAFQEESWTCYSTTGAEKGSSGIFSAQDTVTSASGDSSETKEQAPTIGSSLADTENLNGTISSSFGNVEEVIIGTVSETEEKVQNGTIFGSSGSEKELLNGSNSDSIQTNGKELNSTSTGFFGTKEKSPILNRTIPNSSQNHPNDEMEEEEGFLVPQALTKPIQRGFTTVVTEKILSWKLELLSILVIFVVLAVFNFLDYPCPHQYPSIWGGNLYNNYGIRPHLNVYLQAN